MKRCYIAGPITGIPEKIYKNAFEAAKRHIQASGNFIPVSPVELNHVHDNTWEAFMKVDLRAMLTCQAIYMLDGWENSKGATIEWQLAGILGMEVFYENNEHNHHAKTREPITTIYVCNDCGNAATKHADDCKHYRKLVV
jgi:hypothetical protein